MSTRNPDSDTTDRHWHIDRKVPLALVYLLVAQFIGDVIFASNLLNQISNQEKRISFIENQRVSERLGTLESQMADSKARRRQLAAPGRARCASWSRKLNPIAFYMWLKWWGWRK